MRTPEERKEWERLCRQYKVDSLYEAIEGCREELEFLVHCAERLEPLPDDDTPALRPRRATIADHAVSVCTKRRFMKTGNAVSLSASGGGGLFLTKHNFINIINNIKYGKLEIYQRKQ